MGQANPSEPGRPQPGDVLFTIGKKFGLPGSRETFGNVFFQLVIDPHARASSRYFEHVAVAISSEFALEAVPGEGSADEQASAPADPKEIAEWSGVELRSGVRLKPLADIFIPAARNGTEFVALRNRNATAAVEGQFDPATGTVFQLFGSEYSLDELKQSALEKLRAFPNPWLHVPEPWLTWLSKKFNWTSTPADIASLMGFGKDSGSQTEKDQTSNEVPFHSGTYFCSSLVSSLLEMAGLFVAPSGSRMLTPSGLFQLLHSAEDWSDVTGIYERIAATPEQFGLRPAPCAASYYERLAFLLSIQRGWGVDWFLAKMGKALADFSKDLDKVQQRLFRMMGVPPQSGYTESVPASAEMTMDEPEIAQLASQIADPQARTVFLAAVRDFVSLLKWGLVSRETFEKQVSEAYAAATSL